MNCFDMINNIRGKIQYICSSTLICILRKEQEMTYMRERTPITIPSPSIVFFRHCC